MNGRHLDACVVQIRCCHMPLRCGVRIRHTYGLIHSVCDLHQPFFAKYKCNVRRGRRTILMWRVYFVCLLFNGFFPAPTISTERTEIFQQDDFPRTATLDLKNRRPGGSSSMPRRPLPNAQVPFADVEDDRNLTAVDPGAYDPEAVRIVMFSQRCCHKTWRSSIDIKTVPSMKVASEPLLAAAAAGTGRVTVMVRKQISFQVCNLSR